jgi:hypothetical protein
MAVQLVTPVLGARRVVITFVKQQHQEGRWTSSALGTMVQIVDYTKQDVAETIGKGNVDSMFDMIGESLYCVPVMKRGGALSVSVWYVREKSR